MIFSLNRLARPAHSRADHACRIAPDGAIKRLGPTPCATEHGFTMPRLARTRKAAALRSTNPTARIYNRTSTGCPLDATRALVPEGRQKPATVCRHPAWARWACAATRRLRRNRLCAAQAKPCLFRGAALRACTIKATDNKFGDQRHLGRTRGSAARKPFVGDMLIGSSRKCCTTANGATCCVATISRRGSQAHAFD